MIHSADFINRREWLTEAEVEAYATEYSCTGFISAPQGYRVGAVPTLAALPRRKRFPAVPPMCLRSLSPG